MTYRPDELANQSEIERDAQTRSNVKRGAGLALSAGVTLGAGVTYGSLAKKLLPYLSGSVPLNIAMNAIKKFSPKTADFLNRGRDLGLDIQEGMDFVKDNMGTKKTDVPKSLFERLMGGVDINSLDKLTQNRLKFMIPIAAQAEQQGKDEKDPAVKKLSKKIKDILKGKVGLVEKELERFYEGNPQEEDQSMQPQQPQQQMQPQQPQQQMQPQQPQTGQGQQALMAILQKIQASRGPGG